jgi:hypothetical protein
MAPRYAHLDDPTLRRTVDGLMPPQRGEPHAGVAPVIPLAADREA